MKITNAQKKLIENIYGKGDFLEVDDILYYKVSNDNTTYRVDFDKPVYKRMDGVEPNSKDTTANKKKIEENDMDEQVHEDLTMQQVQENYYVETPLTKIDGSFTMFETRVAKEMEARGISREQAKREVEKKLAQKGVSVINTEDLTEDATKTEEEVKKKKESEEEEEREKKKSTDMEILKAENEQLKKDLEEAKKTKEDMDKDLEKFIKETTDFKEKIEKEREAEIEEKRQEKIKKIMTDFVGVTEEKLKDKTLDQLVEQEEILTQALKKDTKDEDEEKHDMEKHLDLIQTKTKELQDRYKCEV